MEAVRGLIVVRGDITGYEADAIVNAANERMLGGGGVDGAIHRAAGPELLDACRAVDEVSPGVRCPTGDARVTPAFRLPARLLIHTVGPIWRGGNHGEPDLLASCYRTCLQLALKHGARSIAFPAISCGVFCYPIGLAAQIAVRECATFLRHDSRLESVALVAFEAQIHGQLRETLERYGKGLAVD